MHFITLVQLEHIPRSLAQYKQQIEEAFKSAAKTWESVIRGPKTLKLVIYWSVEKMDGRGEILAKAGWTKLGPKSGLPIEGVMQFDTADVKALLQQGLLVSTIVHEMGHVLGFGTLWERQELLALPGDNDNYPVFIGPSAMEEYAKLLRKLGLRTVPVENTGGEGTKGGHWREEIFGAELMTGYVDDFPKLSRLTLASLEDLGYEVRYANAEPYHLPVQPEPRRLCCLSCKSRA